MSSGTRFTFTGKANARELDASGEIMPLLYPEIEAGHPRFYVALTNGEIKFFPDPTGAMTTMLWHQYEREESGKRPWRSHPPFDDSSSTQNSGYYLAAWTETSAAGDFQL